MVAPESKRSKKAKKMGFRNMFCSVEEDPETQVVGSPKAKKQEDKKRQKEERKAQAKADAEFLARAHEAVLEQAEKLPTRTLSWKPSTHVRSLEDPVIASIAESVSKSDIMSLEAPVLSSIVASATNSQKADADADADADVAAGVVSKSSSKLSKSGSKSSKSGSKSSKSSSKSSKGSGRSKTLLSSTRIVVCEDTSPPPKNEAEQTIINLLLSDVWSGNQAIVECSVKLINICLERDPQSAQSMVSVGGHTVMLGIMKKWNGNAKIQAHACHFIGKCCSCGNGNKAFADAALKYGALTRIQKALRKFPKYLMVQTAGCQALEQMMLTCTDHRAVMDGINIALVVAAMGRLTVTAPLQKACAGILQGLAEDSKLAQTIVLIGGMEVLGGAYHRFCDASDADHMAIRQRCRATFPKLMKDDCAPPKKMSLKSACTCMSPSSVGCHFFA